MDIKRTSWHYRLLSHMGVETWRLTDSCEYTRKVLSVIWWSLFFGVAALVMAGDTLAWLAAMLTSCSLVSPNFPTVMVLAMALAVSIVVTLSTVDSWWVDMRSRQHKQTKSPSFVKQAYRRWRDKYCTKINYLPDE